MSPRSGLLLNGEWEFAEGGDGPAPAGGWRRVRVPHRSREFEEDPPVSGWYRTSLSVPGDWETGDGRRLLLDLDRVRHYGRAYLDGAAVGEHHHLRLPWLIDLTERAAPGSGHELLLFTHSCRGRYAHPGARELSEAAEMALDTRFWRTSAATVGIEGDAWLRCRPSVHLADPYATTSVWEKTLSAEVAVRNDGPEPFSGLVAWEVARAGETLLRLPPREVEVGPGETAVVGCTEEWADAVPWGRPPYGEPVLYFLRIDLSSDRQGPVDRGIVRFGFREVRADGKLLLLNGEQLMPWGDHTVPYVYERQWLTRKFTDLAAANVSIVEHHRYDPPSVFYDVADESGTFVVGANFCVGTGQVFPEDLDESEARLVMENHLAVADAWIRRTRNHPSILFWDVTDARDPAFCVPLLRKVKELDRTRVAEVTFDPGVADSELVELIDCYRLFSGLEQIEAAVEAVRRRPGAAAQAGAGRGGRHLRVRPLGPRRRAAADGGVVGLPAEHAGARHPRPADLLPRRHGLPRFHRKTSPGAWRPRSSRGSAGPPSPGPTPASTRSARARRRHGARPPSTSTGATRKSPSSSRPRPASGRATSTAGSPAGTSGRSTPGAFPR